MADHAQQQPLHECLRANARNHPDATAYQWYGQAVTWAEIDAGSEAFAARLQALGVRQGEPVALFMNNCPQYVMAHYGIQKIGAIVCPCGPLNKEHELAYQLNDLQARVIVSAASLLPVVDKVRATTALAHVFVVHYAEMLPAVAALPLPAELAQLQAGPRATPAGCEDFLQVARSGAIAQPVDAIRWGTHGKPVPGNEIRIIDSLTGQALPTGAVGEIIIRGPGNFLGYWNKPEATAQTLRGGSVHTGDMGCMDADGYLTFMGRFKEMIKVSGYSVFPEEVETILIRHPAIAQAAVICVPDAEKGEVVRAFIVVKNGQAVDAAALVQWSRDNMAAYKVPREVRIIDALPATGAGKVLRRLLKDLA